MCLAYGTSCQIKYLITIGVYLLEKVADSWMGPVIAEARHYVTHNITSSDRTVNVGDDYFGAVVPQEYLTRYLLLTLQATLDGECDKILSRLEI